MPQKINGYKQFLEKNFVGEEMITFVGGMENDEGSLVQLQYINEQLSELSDVYRMVVDKEEGLIIVSADQVIEAGFGPSGLIYIPAEVAVNRRGTILTTDSTQESSNEAWRQLIDPISWQGLPYQL
jgi:hypothetical protein